MSLRRCCALLAGLAATTGCVTTRPFTQSLRDQGWTAADLQAAQFITSGEFELDGGDVRLGVPPQSRASLLAAPDDTTLVVAVRASHLGLELTFARTPGREGGYSLRAVNGQALDGPIEIAGTTYRYFPCVLDVGWRCANPIPPGTRDDRGVTLLVRTDERRP
jgi:hypothetical protein